RPPQGRERSDVYREELLDLRAADARNTREVVDRVPVLVTERPEVADLAVLDGPRLGAGCTRDEPLEPVADAALVRTELLGAGRHALAGAEHDVHEPRRAPLDAGDLLRVEAELEDVVRLRVPGKLRVDDLVPAVGLELEKVRAPGPAGGVVEDGLVD